MSAPTSREAGAAFRSSAGEPALHESNQRVALVIPALDEERALRAVLEDLPDGVLAIVVVVDNGSTDRTAQVARAGGAHVVAEPRRGYGQACLAGLECVLRGEAAPRGFEPLHPGDVIVFMDADHSDHGSDLPSVIAPIVSGEADLVIGSRVLGGATRAALLPQARFGNYVACTLMRWLFGARHTDLGPFRAIRVDALEHLAMHDRDFGWTIEMQLKAAVAGLAVREVPVRYRPRIGESKVTGTLRGSIGAGVKILGWIVGWRLALWFTGRRIPTFRSRASSAR